MKSLYIFFSLILASLLVSCKEEQVVVPATFFNIDGIVESDSIAKVYTMMQGGTNKFTLDTIDVINGSFSFSQELDSVVRVKLYTDSVFTTFYMDGNDSISATITDSTILVTGLSLPYAENSIEDFAGLSSDSLSDYPTVIRDRVKAMKENMDLIKLNTKIPYGLFVDKDGKSFSSLEDNKKGKLFTFWATWDSTSMERVKALKEIEKKTKGRAIEFINVSIDINDSIWQEVIDENKFVGRQARITRGLADDYAKRMGVNNLPYNIFTNDARTVIATDVYGDSLINLIKENTILTKDIPKPKIKAKTKR